MRVSSDPQETDPDLIMTKLMNSKIRHKDFDPIYGSQSTRDHIKGVVFQTTSLAPYLHYVHPPEMAEEVLKDIQRETAETSQTKYLELVRQERSNLQTEESELSAKKTPTKKRPMLPYHLGASPRDFGRAKWLVETLDKPPFSPVDQVEGGMKKNNQEISINDPDLIKAK